MINIVQFGANKGSDHVTALIDEKIIPSGEAFHLYLVEPIKYCIEDLLECYKHVDSKTLETAAIIPNESELEYDILDDKKYVQVYYGEQTNYEVSSLFKSHVEATSRIQHENKSWGLATISPLKVKALTSDELFKKWNIKHVDYLFVDIEGLDNEIVHDINFRETEVNFICWEHAHNKSIDISETYKLLLERGYSIEKTRSESYAYKRKQNESYISNIRHWL